MGGVGGCWCSLSTSRTTGFFPPALMRALAESGRCAHPEFRVLPKGWSVSPRPPPSVLRHAAVVVTSLPAAMAGLQATRRVTTPNSWRSRAAAIAERAWPSRQGAIAAGAPARVSAVVVAVRSPVGPSHVNYHDRTIASSSCRTTRRATGGTHHSVFVRLPYLACDTGCEVTERPRLDPQVETRARPAAGETDRELGSVPELPLSSTPGHHHLRQGGLDRSAPSRRSTACRATSCRSTCRCRRRVGPEGHRH